MEWTQAILEAAEAKQAPVLIQTSMGAAKYMGGYKICKDLITDLVEAMNITVPVAIHLDHGDYESCFGMYRTRLHFSNVRWFTSTIRAKLEIS